MLRVLTTQAEVGMRLAMPVFHPEHPETTLLRAGYALDERGIDRMRALKIPEFWIEYPGLEFIAEHVSPDVLQARGRVGAVMDSVFERLAGDDHAPLQFETFRDAASALTDKLIANPGAARHLHDIAQGNASQARHASEVCFLSLLMGLKLEWYLISQRRRVASRRAKDVVNLGVAGMLHDIGMLFLDEQVLDRWERTRDETDEQWRLHVALGVRHVRRNLDATAIAGIMHHHQHFDGSGFPERDGADGTSRGLRGDEIHVFARIICAADLYDRLRHPPGGDGPVPGLVALSAMRSPPYSEWIDPVVFRALLSVAPACPPGSVVSLDDGSRCVVIESSEEHPCRPKVRALAPGLCPDGTDRCDDPAGVIDLAEQRERTVRTIDGADVSAHVFEATHEDEFVCLSPTEMTRRRGRRIDEQQRAA